MAEDAVVDVCTATEGTWGRTKSWHLKSVWSGAAPSASDSSTWWPCSAPRSWSRCSPGFPPTTTIFFSGVGTLVFIAITRSKSVRMGLPSYTGSSFAFISPVIAAQADGGIPAALCGILAAGAVLFVIGLLVDRFGSRWINVVMPPAVTGAVVALIGLNLAPVAIANFQEQPLTALITLAGDRARHRRRCPASSAGSPSCSASSSATSSPGRRTSCSSRPPGTPLTGWASRTSPLPSWSWRAIGLIVPVVDRADRGEHRPHQGRRLHDRTQPRQVRWAAATWVTAWPPCSPALGGGSGTTTYAENIGVMAATRVYSTAAYIVAGLTAIALAMIPKFGALITSIPIGVLGGATLVLYGLIAVLGGRIWVENQVDFKNPVNLFPAAIGLIMGAANITWTRGDLSFNGIATGTFACIIIYHLMNWIAKVGPNKGALYLPALASPGGRHRRAPTPTPRSSRPRNARRQSPPERRSPPGTAAVSPHAAPALRARPHHRQTTLSKTLLRKEDPCSSNPPPRSRRTTSTSTCVRSSPSSRLRPWGWPPWPGARSRSRTAAPC